MNTEVVIKANNISKKYDESYALDGIDIEVSKGQIMGLIGPNGAGKSTFLQSVLGLLKTEGNLEVLGLDPRKDRHKLLKEVCSITDVAVLPKWMTVQQLLSYMDGVHPGFDLDKCISILSRTNIKLHSKIKVLSRGMVVQLHLSLVMAIDAKILILDEPTAGVDVELRANLWNNINKLNNEGKTIIITTHYLHEAEELCNEIAIVDNGNLITKDTTSNIKSLIDRKQIIISLDSKNFNLDPIMRLDVECEINSDCLIINYKPSEISFNKIFDALQITNI